MNSKKLKRVLTAFYTNLLTTQSLDDKPLAVKAVEWKTDVSNWMYVGKLDKLVKVCVEEHMMNMYFGRKPRIRLYSRVQLYRWRKYNGTRAFGWFILDKRGQRV